MFPGSKTPPAHPMDDGLFEVFPLGLVRADRAGTILRINPIARRLLGLDGADAGLLRLDPGRWQVLHPEGAEPRDAPNLERLLREGRAVQDLTAVVDRPGGKPAWLTVTSAPLPGGDMLLVVGEASEHLRMEREIRRSQVRFQGLLGATQDGFWCTDRSGRITEVNQALCRLTGHPREAFLGSRIQDFDALETPEQVQAHLRLLERQGHHRYLSRLRCRDGSILDVEVSATRVGLSGEILAFFRDLTEQRQAAEALAASEARFRSFFENAPVATWEEDFHGVEERFRAFRAAGIDDLESFLEANPGELLDLASRVKILHVNQASLDLMGAADRNALLEGLPRFFGDFSLPAFRREMGALYRGATRFATDIPVPDAEGRVRILHLALAVVPGFEADLGRVLVACLDLTRQKSTERALAERELQYHALFEGVGDLVLILEPQAESIPRIQDLNAAACRAHGYTREELLSQPLSLLDPLATPASPVPPGLAEGAIARARHRRKDGSCFEVELRYRSFEQEGRSLILAVARERDPGRDAEPAS